MKHASKANSGSFGPSFHVPFRCFSRNRSILWRYHILKTLIGRRRRCNTVEHSKKHCGEPWALGLIHFSSPKDGWERFSPTNALQSIGAKTRRQPDSFLKISD